MAGYRALGVLLAAAALLAVAARAADDDHMIHWKCFKSCTRNCNEEDALDDGAAEDGAPGYGRLNASASVGGGGGVSRRCKTGCLNECFEDLPALCYQQCVVSTCLCLPPYSKEKMACMKKCCDKCFHHGPGPKPPTPKPGPGPKPPGPPAPKAPTPKPPTPKPPTPKPPSPKPKPPTPKAPPPPKKPCPLTRETVDASGPN
ncbi:unnamed protein product [Urochloa humidicola]